MTSAQWRSSRSPIIVPVQCRKLEPRAMIADALALAVMAGFIAALVAFVEVVARVHVGGGAAHILEVRLDAVLAVLASPLMIGGRRNVGAGAEDEGRSAAVGERHEVWRRRGGCVRAAPDERGRVNQ